MGAVAAVSQNISRCTPHPDLLPSRGEGIINEKTSGHDAPSGNRCGQNAANHVDPALISAKPRTIRLTLEYDGSGYHGWQRQLNALTIQEVVETGLSRLIGQEVRLHGSGRTDAGVHALGQVAHFRSEAGLPLAAFREGLNSLLPRDIVILDAREAPADFHARYGAKAKTYEYRILNRPVRSPLHLHHCWWLAQPLELDRTRAATMLILGEQDFAGFQASGSSVKTTTRRVLAASWEERPGGWKYFSITANGFLRGMVRALVGTLVEVGWGKRPPEDLVRLLAAKDRRLAGPSAPAAGLYLAEVMYGESFKFPVSSFEFRVTPPA
jgi:tRNA pseudouridine38-40 synthase